MENRYTDHKVDNGKMYYYVVSAVNAVGEGTYSEESQSLSAKLGSCRYWPFDEAGGTAASDVWNGGEAQLVNNSRFDTGKYDTGIHLSGGHITLPAGVTETWKDFTLSLWVKPDRVEDWARIVDCGTGTDNNLFLTIKQLRPVVCVMPSCKGRRGNSKSIRTSVRKPPNGRTSYWCSRVRQAFSTPMVRKWDAMRT